MRKEPLAFLFLVFFLGLLPGICAEDVKPAASTPVIVIAVLGGSKADVPEWQPALGQGISEMLIESLEGSDKNFQVLENTEAAGPQNDVKPGASSSAGSKRASTDDAAGSGKPDTSEAAGSENPNTAVPVDSDFTFCGEVTQFAVQTSGSKLGDFISSSPLAGVGATVTTAHVQIQWRVVDSATKKVIKRGISAASASGSDFDMADLTTTGGKAAVAGSATAFSKNAAGGKKGTNNYSNIFKGLILGDSSSGAGGGAGSSNGSIATSAAAKSQKAPAPAASPTGGASAGNYSGTTAQSAKASSQTAPKTGSDIVGNGGVSAGETISYGNPTFINSALGKATAKVITDISKQLDAISLPEPGRIAKVKAAADALKHTPGTVLAVAGKDTIIVSLGGKEGFKEGDVLELYQPTDVKDDKGNVVFTDEKSVGEITLSAVQEERSRGSYAGDAQVQQGWTVKAR
jgi:hypothetical protein